MNMLFYHWVMPVIYIMCVLAFLLFAYDKHCAVYSKFRIPEWVLVLVTVAMGAFGSLCGMVLFNHKTSKALFYILVQLALLLQIIGTVAVLWFL